MHRINRLALVIDSRGHPGAHAALAVHPVVLVEPVEPLHQRPRPRRCPSTRESIGWHADNPAAVQPQRSYAESNHVAALWFRAAVRRGFRAAVTRGTGLVRMRCGHQNQRPSRAAIEGVMKERTTRVSNSRPIPMVLPTWARMTRALRPKESLVNANTRPAEVTTAPVPAIDRMMPVLMPA